MESNVSTCHKNPDGIHHVYIFDGDCHKCKYCGKKMSFQDGSRRWVIKSE